MSVYRLQDHWSSGFIFPFAIPDRSQYEHSDIIAGYAGDFAPHEFQGQADMSWNMLR